jgi:hypothetical protein
LAIKGSKSYRKVARESFALRLAFMAVLWRKFIHLNPTKNERGENIRGG